MEILRIYIVFLPAALHIRMKDMVPCS